MKLYEFNKKNSLILLVSLAFAFLMSNNVWHIQNILSESLLVISFTALTAILAFLTIWAGLLVVESLLLLGGEISLAMFLAQSYCAPEVTRTVTSDRALNSFIILALTYILYLFLKKIYEKLVDQAKKFKAIDGKWSKEAIFMFLFLFLFVGLFMYMIYLVISPIVMGLCIYK